MGDIYFELASITLSSCLLLAIKDNMDCERARSRTLKRQYAYYTRLKYTLYDSLDSLFASFGLPHMAWNTLSSKESAEGRKLVTEMGAPIQHPATQLQLPLRTQG